MYNFLAQVSDLAELRPGNSIIWLVNKGDHNKLVHFKHFIIFSTLTFKQPHKPKSKKESMLGHAMMSQHDDATWCEV